MPIVPLLDYLTLRGFEKLELIPKLKKSEPHNTRSVSFRFDDLVVTIPQDRLNYEDLIAYGRNQLLGNFNLRDHTISPPKLISNEAFLQDEVVNRLVMPYVRRAIEATSNGDLSVLSGNTWPGNRREGKPDISFLRWDGPASQEIREMRFPLEVKLSSNWKSEWRTSTTARENQEYRQALSQIHFYMDLFNTRHGGILTDQELVIVKRTNQSTGGGRDTYGVIRVYEPIPYTACGACTIDDGFPTVPLALWSFATRGDWYLRGHPELTSKYRELSDDDDENSDNHGDEEEEEEEESGSDCDGNEADGNESPCTGRSSAKNLKRKERGSTPTSDGDPSSPIPQFRPRKVTRAGRFKTSFDAVRTGDTAEGSSEDELAGGYDIE